MPTEPHRILDVNGRLTTVYKKPEGATNLPNRLSTVSVPQKYSVGNDLKSYADGRYVSIAAAHGEDSMNSKIAAGGNDESCLFMVSDMTLGDNDELNINGGSTPVLIHLDTLRPAKINVTAGDVVIKTYAESHLPTITATDTASVTVIVAESTGANVVLEGSAHATVIPESGAFGTVYVQGANAAVLEDSQVKHQMLILG